MLSCCRWTASITHSTNACEASRCARSSGSILTASGGPFRTTPIERMREASVEEALAHPTWQMGSKITIDSATLMNKGLEVIEAGWLFGFTTDRISVAVHPQSIVHSMIEMVDGSIIAQLGVTDMRLMIQYALTYPDRLPTELPPLGFDKLARLEFFEPDLERFPCLRLAYEAMREGGTMPAALSALTRSRWRRFSIDEQSSWTFLG